jgi:hypothetical protein
MSAVRDLLPTGSDHAHLSCLPTLPEPAGSPETVAARTRGEPAPGLNQEASMSAETERPWSTHCRAGSPTDSTAQHDTAPGIVRDAARRVLERPLLHSFDATLTVREVDEPT